MSPPHAPNRFFFDTEFMENGYTIELISIGCIDTLGRTYYACNVEARLDRANPWVREHVIPQLPTCSDPAWKTRAQIKADLLAFWFGGTATLVYARPEACPPIELWAYYGAYDWVVLCQLWGRMIVLPPAMPMFAMDVKALARLLGDPDLPPQVLTEHNALNDASWTYEAYQFLMRLWIERNERNTP